MYRIQGTGAHTACRLLVKLCQDEDPPAEVSSNKEVPLFCDAKLECVLVAIVVFMATDLGAPSLMFAHTLFCTQSRRAFAHPVTYLCNLILCTQLENTLL